MSSKEDYIKIVTDEQEKVLNAPTGGYGEYRVVWQNGKIVDIITQERIRIK